jgi:hypothetical protein
MLQVGHLAPSRFGPSELSHLGLSALLVICKWDIWVIGTNFGLPDRDALLSLTLHLFQTILNNH